MNLNKFGRWSGIVAAVAMLAMVLQGCGGDDGGSGISQDMYDALQADYDAAVADRDAAMAGQMDAQAAQAAAEARRDAAVAAQAVAEAAAAAAMQAEMDAEAAAMAAMEAQDEAEDEAAAANLNVVAANAARDLAVAAQTAAEAAQMRAEAAQKVAEDAAMAAMEAQEMAEAAQATAEAAQMKAEADLKVAEAAETAAKAAQMTAEAAQMKAEADLKTAQDAQKMAEDDLATAQMERDEALAALETQVDAVAAQRARVDAASIQRSADDLVVKRVNAAGATVYVPTTSTNTVEMFQGNGMVPGDGPDGPALALGNDGVTDSPLPVGTIDPTGELRENRTGDIGDARTDAATTGVMTLTASRVGNTVSFMATADHDPEDTVAAETLISFDATAGADGMTSGMDTVDLAGETKHIYLMSDIDAPLTGSFAGNIPDGLRAPAPDAVDGEFRFPVVTNWVFTTADPAMNRPFTAAEKTAQDAETPDDPDNAVVNLSRHGSLTIELGDFAPSAGAPIQNIQAGGKLAGTFAGVAGDFRCGETGTDMCMLRENVDGDVIAVGMWQFVPASATRALADGDYLIYGAWLKKPDSAVGSGSSAAISAGSDLFDTIAAATDNGIEGLSGAATYTGTAAGFFAERHVDGNNAVSGTFTATAELTANFGVNTTDVGSISGTVDEFVRSDGTEVDWLVNLVSATNTVVDAGGFTAGNTSGNASGANWAGEWGVQYSGNNTIPGGTTRSPSLHPQAVVGTFGAQHGTPSLVATDESPDMGFAAVIGGFGARR